MKTMTMSATVQNLLQVETLQCQRQQQQQIFFNLQLRGILMKALLQIVVKGAFDGEDDDADNLGTYFTIEGLVVVVAKSTSPQLPQILELPPAVVAVEDSAKVITSNKEAATCSNAQDPWIYWLQVTVINQLLVDLGITNLTIASIK